MKRRPAGDLQVPLFIREELVDRIVIAAIHDAAATHLDLGDDPARTRQFLAAAKIVLADFGAQLKLPRRRGVQRKSSSPNWSPQAAARDEKAPDAPMGQLAGVSLPTRRATQRSAKPIG